MSGEDLRYEPVHVKASAETGVRVTWADGHESVWDLEYIRGACGCATCNEFRKSGEEVYPRPGAPQSLEVVDADLMGSFGVSLFWNDGHHTGIYQWTDLRDGCPCDECRTTRRIEGRANPLDR